MRHSDLLKQDEEITYEACLKDSRLENLSYRALKDSEHIIWMRKRWKESNLQQSDRRYKEFLKKIINKELLSK